MTTTDEPTPTKPTAYRLGQALGIALAGVLALAATLIVLAGATWAVMAAWRAVL